jgi:hypothetical protein
LAGGSSSTDTHKNHPMRNRFLTLLPAILSATAAMAQNTDFSFAHGISGLPNAVNVAVDGTTVFAGVNFGELRTTTIAPGPHTIQVLDGSTVLLTAATTTGADESFTAAAHLLAGGAVNLAVFENDVSAVAIAGLGRFVVRHLANAGTVVTMVQSPTVLNFGVLSNGQELPTQIDPDVYGVSILPIGGFTVPPAPLGTQVAQGVNLAQDAGVIVHLVGEPGTPSFSAIVQNITLPPAVPVTPSACDLTLSGSLVGGSLSTGGALNIGLTGATPDSFVAVFFSLSNTPSTFFGRPLSIGGSSFADVIAFGLADSAGVFARTLTVPPSSVSTQGGSGPLLSWNFFLQAISSDSTSAGFLTTCISDVEPLTIRVN